MKNNLEQLNNRIFAQLNILTDPNLVDKEDLNNEINRTNSVIGLAKTVIEIGKLSLEAELKASNSIALIKKPKMLQSDDDER